MKNLPGVLRKGIIQTKYILAIIIVLMGMMIVMGLYGMSASKQDIMHILRGEASALADAISIMSDKSLKCFDEIEYLVTEKLLTNAWILERLDSEGLLSEEILKDITQQNDIHQISIFDGDGIRILGSHSALDSSVSEDQVAEFFNSGEEEWIIGPDSAGRYFAIIHRRNGGAIVLDSDSSEMLEFRKSVGIGSLIQAFGENEGIEYIVLQDEGGLILASKNVERMKKIAGDSFLENVLDTGQMDMRTHLFGEKEVIEVASLFQIDDESGAIFRIGLSRDEIRAVESRGKNRIILMTLIVLTFGVALLSFLLISQNHSLLSRAYNRIQTYTGMVLENIADGIIVSDSSGNISVFNNTAERIFEKSSNEILGSSVDNLEPSIKRLLDNATSIDKADQASEIAINSPKSGEKLLSVRTSKFAGVETQPDSVVAIIRDVTEAKMMEENMRRTEQLTAMGKLAAAVAHEVRNPLNAISMIGQRLGREFVPQEDAEQYQELTSMVKSESMRLNSIIEQFLEFARPPKLNRQLKDINGLMNETISLVEMQSTENGIVIERKYSYSGDWMVDSEQIKQVLLNLFLNGIEAMPDGGVLSVSNYLSDGALCIEISDTGMGISEEELKRIFDLYFTTKETGTGLGLSVVQRIVAEHGGWLNIDSIPDKGTIFRIYLPANIDG